MSTILIRKYKYLNISIYLILIIENIRCGANKLGGYCSFKCNHADMVELRAVITGSVKTNGLALSRTHGGILYHQRQLK